MLTTRKKLFIDHYKVTRNVTEAARLAGYSAKTARVQGSRLLRDADVSPAIKEFELEESKKLTKETFVDLAMKDYASLESKSGNKPRFLELAGKATGILGGSGEGQSVTNNTQININIAEADTKPLGERLEHIKSLLSPKQ